jgi:hypothetical protein
VVVVVVYVRVWGGVARTSLVHLLRAGGLPGSIYLVSTHFGRVRALCVLAPCE